jgi:acyl-coenzyme A synthetase/AMP-(fatty) acid ligase
MGVESPGSGYRIAPEKLNIAHEALDRSIARGCGPRAALVGDFGAVTYESLQRRVNAVAGGLLALELKRGDLVLIKMSNSPEFAVALLAAIKLGVVPVLVNSLLTAVELAAVLEQTRPQLIFTEASRSEAVRELRGSGRDFIRSPGEAAIDSYCERRYSQPRAGFHRLHLRHDG